MQRIKPLNSRVSTILCAEPQLFVTSIKEAIAFYCETLGFEVAFAHGEPAFYAQVVRDGARLNLRQVTGPIFDTAFRARERDALSVTLILDDAEPLFRAFQESGVVFHQALTSEPWGAQTFIIEDPDGNLICFAGPDSR